MQDLVSILLPFYNAGFSLARCLESILKQTYPNFEVIAVNDGSTDSGTAILSQYASKDSRIKILSLDKNRGIVAALNLGLDHCNGNWVARMDADDLMKPERLSRQINYLKNHPEIDILGARIKLFRYQGELTPGQIRYQEWSNSLITDDEIKSNIYAESPIMHPTFFLKREVYSRLNGYQDNPWAEDYDFLFRAYLSGVKFGKLPEILVEKGDHPTRLARIDDRCKRRAMFKAKAVYFGLDHSLWKHKKKILIVGTGSAGKMALQALEREGTTIEGFVDNKKADNLTAIYEKPVYSIAQENMEHFLQSNRETLFLLCIGVEEGRKVMESQFQKYEFRSGYDYVRFI